MHGPTVTFWANLTPCSLQAPRHPPGVLVADLANATAAALDAQHRADLAAFNASGAGRISRGRVCHQVPISTERAQRYVPC